VTARSGRYGWWLIGLLWFASFLNAADRSILVATMPRIRDEFCLDVTQLALINSVFFWVYAFAAFASGRLGDATRRSRVIGYGLIAWSIATGSMSLAWGYASLVAIRVAVAAGESTYYPSATALISDWHPTSTRSRALSLHQTGLFAGAGLGALAAGALADRFDWRAPFVVFAVAGILWGAVLLRVLFDRRPTADARSAEGKVGGVSPFRAVLGNPAVLILCGVFFLANGASTGVMVWAPTFAHDLLGLDLTRSALVGSTTINLAGFCAVPVGGWLADRLAKGNEIGRFQALAIGLAIAAACLLPLLAARTAGQIALVLVASSIGKGLFDGCIYAAMHDLVAPAARGTAVGLMTTFGFIGAGLSPILVAKLSGSLGLASGMASLAAAYVLAVLILATSTANLRRAILRL
jgi:MFS family permease